ncbi:MAG TPA: GAP family protein [Solirubrobacteraceae bacterium]
MTIPSEHRGTPGVALTSCGTGPTARLKARAHDALGRGSTVVALAVGAALGIPGPFDLLALGRLARGGYSVLGSIAILLVFNLVKLLLIEIPLLSYTLEPERTVNRVDRFTAWMKANRIEVIAAVVAVVGLVLIGRGIARLG